MDAVIENATVKRAHSQVEQVKNQYRIEKRNWWNYFRLNGNYAYGRYNVLNDNSDSYNDWYQSTTASSRYTFNVGASFSVGLGDLFNRPLRLKNYRYNIEQLQYTQEEVMEERRLKVLEAYNNVTYYFRIKVQAGSNQEIDSHNHYQRYDEFYAIENTASRTNCFQTGCRTRRIQISRG